LIKPPHDPFLLSQNTFSSREQKPCSSSESWGLKVSLRPYLRLLRVHQWVKNTFVLAPLIFSGKFLDPEAVKQALWAFFAFCLASSATYILNDLRDIEKDRAHPVKRLKRPLAAGIIFPRTAKILLISIYASLLGFLIFPSTRVFMLPVIAYLVLNLAYSFKLKNIPVLDIFCIAAGFMLRLFAGGEALNIEISSWMLVTTLSLALFLASTKRLQELRTQGDNARKVLKHYTVKLLESYAQISAAGALVFYGLYVISSRPGLVLSIPFVIFGLFRYWYLVESEGAGESPTEVLLRDWPLVITVTAWVVFCAWKTLKFSPTYLGGSP